MSAGAAPDTSLWRDALAQVDSLLQQPSDSRERTLAELATTRPQLHALVNALLASNDAAESGRFLDPSNASGAATLQDGATLGPYRIVSRIGVGGMGAVWLARRIDGMFEGEVAIKTLHPWLAQGALRERFLREAQLLGRVSHPNIARLLDAGVGDQGSIYLVLEYVRGRALDEFCDERRLGVAARLRLFLAACTAVAHAHANLVVHRDLKPANILVTDAGDVKLLDFGVATLLEADAPVTSDLTRLTGRVFTPEFAAPEQLRGEAITTATDVYSMGAMLYALLTGLRPHDDSLTGAALEHAVLHSEVALPSRRVRDAHSARELAGDLDNIVARALEKRPDDRYASIAELAADVERHLKHQPVRARTASPGYRTAKFLRRNRVPVALGGIALVAVFGGLALALWQAEVAGIEARKATAIRDFLVGIFERNSVAHADGARARKTTAEELLAQSVREIRTGLGDAPEVRSELLGVMSHLYAQLDLQREAIPLLEEKLANERATLAPDALAIAKTLSSLSYSQVQVGAYAEAEKSATEALRIFRANGDVSSLEHGLAFGNLAQTAYRTGARDSKYIRDQDAAGLTLIEKHHPRNKWRVEMLLGLVRAANLDSDFATALRYCEQALALVNSKTVDGDGIMEGTVLQTYGNALAWVNRQREGEDFLKRAIAAYDRAGGVDHSFAIDGRRELGTMYMWSGRRVEARELLGAALASQERVKGADDPELTAYVRNDFASTLYLRGELALAEPHMRRAFDSWVNVSAATLPRARMNLARLYVQQGRFDQAAQQLEGLEATVVGIFGKGSWLHGTALVRLGELAGARGRSAEAREYFERLVREFPEAEDALSANPAAARLGLIRLALADGRFGAARDDARALISAIQKSRGRVDLADEEPAAQLLLGVALARGGEIRAALPELERAVQARERMDAPESLWLAEARLHLAEARWRAGQRAAAARLLELARLAHQAQPSVGPQYSRYLDEVRKLISG
jgi:tetratricopeptide (TPR) repeat protein/tRNA A-37 threonylcarbamoyl transferase component Bud32